MAGSDEQKRLMGQFRDRTGWEFMGVERVRSGDHAQFIQQWNRNVQWLRDVADETDAMLNEYRGKYAS